MMRILSGFAATLLAIHPLAGVQGATAAEPPATRRPNLVMVLVDDMGWGDFSCFGNRAAKTPHADRLAAEGLRFTQFYVNSPICSPSRTALTTGQHPRRWRIHSFLDHRKANEHRAMAQWLDPAAPTLSRMLQGAGYATGHFGKWHLGGQRDVGDAPLITAYGFDESLTQFEGLGPRLLPLCDAHDGKPPRRHALGSDQLGRGPITWMDRERITGGFVEAAIRFMRKAVAAGRPFYINLWPDDVHSPFFPPASLRGDGGKRALYHGVLQSMDAQLGVLFDFIRSDPSLRSNTLVVLCSDNGPEAGAGSAGPFRGGKTTLYEGGVRSPLVVWGPSWIAAGKAGTTLEEPVLCAMDLVPSLLAIAGAGIPRDTFDGENLSATLLGKSNASRTRPICWMRPPDRPGEDGMNLPDLAIRDGCWKLLCEADGSLAQLHNLDQDPGETRNLAKEEPTITDRLRRQVLAWHASFGANPLKP